MELRNKSTINADRQDEKGRFLRVKPGETMEVSEAVGAYLLKAEPFYWEEMKPPLKPKPKPKSSGKDGE